MFHRWLGTDDTGTDTCIGCGVHAPVRHPDPDHPVVVSYSPLPLSCPAPEPDLPHYFTIDVPRPDEGSAISCEWCGVRITDHTQPDTLNWECRRHPLKEH